MFTTPEQFAAANKATVDSLLSVANTALASAERIEYNTNTEVAELFHRAWVRSGEDQVKGDYIWYDAISEKYLVTAGKSGDSKGQPARVRAIIQPKNKAAQGDQPGDSGQRLELKASGGSGVGQAPK